MYRIKHNALLGVKSVSLPIDTIRRTTGLNSVNKIKSSAFDVDLRITKTTP